MNHFVFISVKPKYLLPQRNCKMKHLSFVLFMAIFCITSKDGLAQKKLPTIDYTKAFKDKKLTKVSIGECNFPSGVLLVGDPFDTDVLNPLTKKITPGKYPVEIMVNPVPEEDYYVIAFAILKLKKEKAVTWELAITTDLKESQLATLKSDGFFGFESKSQLASFFDLEAFEKFNKEKKAYYKKHKKGNFYTDFLAAEFKAYSGSNKYSLEIGDWNMHKVDNTSSVPMFSTGGQAGRFPVYWGLNKAGEIVECVIDFFVVDIK